MNHRFFIEDRIRPGDRVSITGDEGRHAVRVSRVRVGEEIELISDSAGHLARVVGTGRDTLEAEVLGVLESRESPARITLSLSLIKPDLFEMVLRKGTELGVHRFVPLEADRVEPKHLRVDAKRDRWTRIVVEAVKQSGRVAVPVIEEPIRLDDLIKEPEGLVVLYAGAEAAKPEVCASRTLTLCIGPEGGWSDRELDLVRARGALALSLGPRRMRAETAAIAAVVWAQLACGDFGS